MKVFTEREYWNSIYIAMIIGATSFYLGQLVGGLFA
jgi:hypothetical protein